MGKSKFNNNTQSNKRRMKPKIFIYSLIAVISLALAYYIHWAFIAISAAMIFLNQKEIMGN